MEYKNNPERVLYLNRDFDFSTPVFRSFTKDFAGVAKVYKPVKEQLEEIKNIMKNKGVKIPKNYLKIFNYYDVKLSPEEISKDLEFSMDLIKYSKESKASRNFEKMDNEGFEEVKEEVKEEIKKEAEPHNEKIYNPELEKAIAEEEAVEEKKAEERAGETPIPTFPGAKEDQPVMIREELFEEFTPIRAESSGEITPITQDYEPSETGFEQQEDENYTELRDLLGPLLFIDEDATEEEQQKDTERVNYFIELIRLKKMGLANATDFIKAELAGKPPDQVREFIDDYNMKNASLAEPLNQPISETVPFATDRPAMEHPPKYHKYSIKIYLGSDTLPRYDPELEKNIYSGGLSKEEIIQNINNIIVKYGADLFISGTRKSDTLDELHELTQLQFCLMRNLATGPRVPTASMPISELANFYNKLQGPAQVEERVPEEQVQGELEEPQEQLQVQQTPNQSFQVQLTPNQAFEKVVEEYRTSEYKSDGKPRFNEDIVRSTLEPPPRNYKGPNSMIDPTNNYILPVRMNVKRRTVRII